MRRFAGDVRGGIAVIAGLTVPVMVLGVGVAVEYGNVARRHTQLQKAVDAAALASAEQLRLSNNSNTVIDSTAKAVVAQNAPPPDGVTTDVSSSVSSKRNSVQVSATETVRSVIGKTLTLPSSTISVTATASIAGTARLCLLTLDTKNSKSLYLESSSLITAAGCALYSNSLDKSGLRADSLAKATASLICSAGGIDNNGALLSPTPTTDCPALADPLAKLPRPTVGFCTGLESPTKITTSQTIFPGTYCAGLQISGTAQVYLQPGVYVMANGSLLVQNTAGLIGQNVGFYFAGKSGGLRFDPDTTINLTAPKSGEMAGVLLSEDNSVTTIVALPTGPTGAPPPPPPGSPPMRTYRITSNNAPNLLGTIYLPVGRVIIDSNRPVADMSAYTVIVAQQIDLNSGPNLYLNTNYGATDIPVPDGVGPKSGNVTLTQ